MDFIEIEQLKTKRYNKLMELVSGYDQSVHSGVEFKPHHKDLEEIELIDTELCCYFN